MLLGAVERALTQLGVSRLPSWEGRLLVGCSGGMDSVVLAHAVATLYGGRRIVLGHVDHAVRPSAPLDRAFVSTFADGLGADFVWRQLPPGNDSEDRLRLARYDALEEMRQMMGCAFVLTAHHRDDQAETILMGLLRWASLRNLFGIPFRNGLVVRPMLAVSRRDIEAYAIEHRLAWREDPTNLEPRYLRNRVRKELLPLLESRYRPGIRARLSRWPVVLENAGLEAAGLERQGYAFGPGRPEGDLASQWRVKEPTGSKPRRSPQLARGGQAVFPGTLSIYRRPWKGGLIPRAATSALFDAGLFEAPTIRLLEPGDRIQPFGMQGRRKIVDLLRESGVPPARRFSWMVVTNEAGAVVWIPGVARSGDAPVGPATREVWEFKFTPRELQADVSRATLDDVVLSDSPSQPSQDGEESGARGD